MLRLIRIIEGKNTHIRISRAFFFKQEDKLKQDFYGDIEKNVIQELNKMDTILIILTTSMTSSRI